MFGYVKPDKENLLVKDLHLYKAVYCGLCDSIKKNVSFFLPFTLSYDFVFLTMVRAVLLKEEAKTKKGRCRYNVLKKTFYNIPEESALFSARSALILTAENISDDLQDFDTPFFKKALLFPFHLYLKKKIKRLSPEYKVLAEKVRFSLEEIRKAEKMKSADVDFLCSLFGKILSDTLSFGLDGENLIIAREIGASIGRYIYLIDAFDDAEKDEKSGSYNPLLIKYGSAEKVKSSAKEIDVALSMHTKDALLSFNLTEKSVYTDIITNVLSLGLGKESYRIMTKSGEKR